MPDISYIFDQRYINFLNFKQYFCNNNKIFKMIKSKYKKDEIL